METILDLKRKEKPLMLQKSLKVLLVEDEKISAGIIKKVLKETHLPHQVIHKSSGHEALNMFHKQNFDLIVLDYLLQDTDGYHLLKKIRKLEKDIPIIILTGKGNENIAVKMLKNGADDYLIKSQLNPVLLNQVIREVFNKRKKKKEEREDIGQIKERASYLDSIIKNSLGSIALIDESGYFKFHHNYNAKNIFGLENNEIVGKNLFEFLVPEDIEKFKNALKSVQADQQTTMEVKAQMPKKGFVIGYTKINNQLHNPILKGYVINAIDITPIRESQQKILQYYEKLKRAYKELDDFTYIIAHDLKTPLNWVNKINAFIEEDIAREDWETLKTHQEMMTQSITKMENLINGVWDYSRITTDNREQLQKIDLNHLLRELEKNFKINYKFSLEIPEKLPVINTNKIQLEQIFYNLLANAIHHNDKDHAYVSVNYQLIDDNKIQMILTDNGPGIPDQYQNKVYNMFFSLKDDEFRQHNRGIGLTIVKKLIEKNDEKIWFETEKGKGTTFYFTWHINWENCK